MCEPQEEIFTLRDFLFCQNPGELADNVHYILQDEDATSRAAEYAAGSPCGPTGQNLPSIEGTPIVKSFDASNEQARDDDQIAEAERMLKQNSSLVDDTDEDDTPIGARKKKKNRSRKKPNPEENGILLKDQEDLSLIHKMLHKYDRASAKAAPNVELMKVFENEEFVTFRKVAYPIRSQKDFGGYDETEVRIEHGSECTGSMTTDASGVRSPRVPRQVMIVVSKKKL